MWAFVTCASALSQAPAPARTPINIFIESTDAFRVTFYANYFKFLQYGLDDSIPNTMLTSVDDMKFKGAAVLGDACAVVTQPIEDDVFEQTIVREDGEILISARTGVAPVVDLGGLDDEPTLTLPHVARFDDIDARTHAFSLDAALRGFERSRSTLLGGPDELAAVLKGGVTVVVARVERLRYVPVPTTERGDRVIFHTRLNLRGRFVVFHHELRVAGLVSARATVTCVCVDATSGKPIAIPPGLADKLASILARSSS